MSLTATILLGTLKPKLGGVISNTRVLSEILCDELAKYEVKSEIIYLAEHTIVAGTRTIMSPSDEWPSILKKLIASDILIFATPIWWGSHSSLMQRVMERLDELNDKIIATGQSEFLNKVGGMVITGAEDGVQNVIANLANFMVWNGLTLPPACSLSYLGSHTTTTKLGLKNEFLSQPSTMGMAKTMARNLVHIAKVLKENPLPLQEKESQAIR